MQSTMRRRMLKWTFDFTTMYTCLKHDRIMSNVREAVAEAHKYVDRLCTIDTHRGKFYKMTMMKQDDVMQHVEFIVKNTFLYADGILRHQEIGLPMGTNCAPELANLTLYVDERNFIDALQKENFDEAVRYNCTFRFIDDVLTWNNAPPSQTLYGLEWKETTNTDQSVTFLGGKITNTNGRINLSIFDKATEWQFPIIRYPHLDSNVPYHQPSGVFQGQLCRYRIVCNSVTAFKNATTQLVRSLLLLQQA
jgi:hypothetical protein